MQIHLLKTSKPALDVSDLVDTYIKRMKPFVSIQHTVCKESELPKKLGTLKKSSDFLVILDERGKTWSTKQLSEKIRTWTEDPAIKTVTFVIGGPYGVSDEIRKTAHTLWSLSPLTLQGDLAWLLCAEQLYRSYTLLHKIPYHH